MIRHFSKVPYYYSNKSIKYLMKNIQKNKNHIISFGTQYGTTNAIQYNTYDTSGIRKNEGKQNPSCLVCELRSIPFSYRLALMAHLRLTNSLSSPLPNKLVTFSSQSLILHRPFFFAKPKPLIRFARRNGPPLVLAAVGQAEPNRLPQTNAPQVLPGEEVCNSTINFKFRSNAISFHLVVGSTIFGFEVG